MLFYFITKALEEIAAEEGETEWEQQKRYQLIQRRDGLDAGVFVFTKRGARVGRAGIIATKPDDHPASRSVLFADQMVVERVPCRQLEVAFTLSRPTRRDLLILWDAWLDRITRHNGEYAPVVARELVGLE